MHRFRLGPNLRVACIGDAQFANVMMASGCVRLSIEMPTSAARIVGEELVQLDTPASIPVHRPAPPRYQWGDLVRRADKRKTTDADALALRDLFFHLGVEIERR